MSSYGSSPMQTLGSQSTSSHEKKGIGFIRLLVGSIILIIVGFALMLFLTGNVRAMEVISGSMEPTVQVGDRLLVRAVDTGTLQHGDLVIIIPPDDAGPEMVKRLVGLPGDTVAYRDERFFVNDQAFPPPDPEKDRHLTPNRTIRIPDGHYYVLGDNRPSSHDSEQFGPVPENLITGKVIYRYGPRHRMGAVE